MDSISLKSENIKTTNPHRLLFNVLDKTNLKRSDKYVALSNLSMYHTWYMKKKSYQNSKSKISAPMWNEQIELADGSYSVSRIQD